nr:very short patch repair endonuclease [Micromonospora sp. NBS 11-29]
MKADIVFRPARVAVEVRGCFWHGCPEHHRRPTANSEYWVAKIDRNVARDRKNEDLLRDAGWVLITVWEHEAPSAAASRVEETVRRRRALATGEGC